MNQIINLDDHRPSKGSQVSGSARCMDCGNVWVAIAPSGTQWFECPSCHCVKGRLLYPYEPPDGSTVFECPCGNDLLILTGEGPMCPNCGKWIET